MLFRVDTCAHAHHVDLHDSRPQLCFEDVLPFKSLLSKLLMYAALYSPCFSCHVSLCCLTFDPPGVTQPSFLTFSLPSVSARAFENRRLIYCRTAIIALFRGITPRFCKGRVFTFSPSPRKFLRRRLSHVGVCFGCSCNESKTASAR